MAEIKWIKITTDMFDDEKIRLIEKMPEADTLIVIWVKLICLAGRVNDRGAIYITPTLPYNEEKLSAVLGRDLNTVRLALGTFRDLEMIEFDKENGALVLINFEKHQNIDGMERVRDQNLKRVHLYRDRKLLEAGNVTVTLRHATDKIRIDKNRAEEEKENELLNLVNEKRYDEVIIGHEKLSTIIKCFTGEQPCHETNLRLYREQLKKLGIELKDLGITDLTNP